MKLKKFIFIMAVFFGATAATVDEAPVKVHALTSQYTVKTGDTLTGIAHELYGRASAWKDLQNTNPNVIKNENLITPGMIITYSVEAAQQSMAQVLRSKEIRKLAGKSPVVTSKNSKSLTHKVSRKSVVVSSVPFGPAPAAKIKKTVPVKMSARSIASVRSQQPVKVRTQVQPAPVKKPSKNPIGLNGFKDLEF